MIINGGTTKVVRFEIKLEVRVVDNSLEDSDSFSNDLGAYPVISTHE